MREHHIEWPLPLENHSIQNSFFSKYGMLIVAGVMLVLVLLSGLIYLPLNRGVNTVPADQQAAVDIEQMLDGNYVLQTGYLSGRYVLPLFLSLLATGAILFWVLRKQPGKQRPVSKS